MNGENMDSNNYTSADVEIPVKLITNPTVLHELYLGNLNPFHIQLNPTNRCNLKCEFCSCRDVNKNVEIDLDKLKVFYNKCDSILATTITGGGEPLVYTKFTELIHFLFDKKINIGMSTNGLLLPRYDAELFNKFTWIRISITNKSRDNGCMSAIEPYVINTQCDWAFSFVCSNDIEKDYDVLFDFIQKYNNEVTHFRIVNDLFALDDRVMKLKEKIYSSVLPTDKLIFQERTHYTTGMKECRIAMIKPVITAEGEIHNCCGAQYIKKNMPHKYTNATKMGTICDNPNDIFGENKINKFNGTICEVCYYNSYNKFLSYFFKRSEHENFI
jgi:organic radical activating enzyme